MRLRSRCGCRWVGPEGGEVGGELRMRVVCSWVSAAWAAAAGAVVLVLGCLEGAEGVVPVGLERVSDEPVFGVDGEVAAAGELGAVAGALDVVLAELVGIVGACFELGLNGERDLECERGDGVEQQLADRGVDAVAGDDEAASALALDRFADAL